DLVGPIAKQRHQRRAAYTAEGALLARRRFEARQQRLAGAPAKRRRRHGRARAKRRAGRLAAHRAVTVNHRAERSLHHIADAATQTTPWDFLRGHAPASW